jgi:hypothetical protein
MRVMLTIVAVAVAASVACGGDRSGTSKGTRAERAIQTEAQARAESIVLALTDFPDGWRALSSEDTQAVEAQFRTCLGTDYSTLTIIGDADSKDFAIEDATDVSSSATVYASEGQAKEALQEYSDGMESDAAEDCFREVIEKEFKTVSRELKIDEVDVRALNVTAPSEVEETRAWQVSFEATYGESKGGSTTAFSDFVVLHQGDSLATIQASDVYSPFDSELRDQLLKTVASRMSS